MTLTPCNKVFSNISWNFKILLVSVSHCVTINLPPETRGYKKAVFTKSSGKHLRWIPFLVMLWLGTSIRYIKKSLSLSQLNFIYVYLYIYLLYIFIIFIYIYYIYYKFVYICLYIYIFMYL